jgi:hypothetical protein
MDLREIGWGSVEWIQLAQDTDRWRVLWIRWWTFWFWRHGVSYLEGQERTCSLCAWNYLRTVSSGPGFLYKDWAPGDTRAADLVGRQQASEDLIWTMTSELGKWLTEVL